MSELKNLKTFEQFTNEEFNPLKREDWKKTGTSIRKGIGFLTPEEELEKGKELVLNHPQRSKVYDDIIEKGDNDKAEKYLRFWSHFGDEINIGCEWNPKERNWYEKTKRYSPSGSIGSGN
jgi:hypothetical protein